MQSIITHASYRPALSNSFEPVADITAGLQNGTFIAVNASHPVILLKKCEGFFKVYYFLENPQLDNADWDSLADKIRQISGGVPVYGEVTLRGDFVFSVSVFERLGLHPFRTYLRSSMKKPAQKFDEYVIPEYAVPEDADRILELMYSTSNFDVMADHLPARKELDAKINSRSVLKIEAQDELAGIMIFEDTGVKSYTAVLCVSEKFRRNKTGYTLFAHYINMHIDNTELFYLWTDKDNTPAVAFYNYFGYRHDGLKNFIFRM